MKSIYLNNGLEKFFEQFYGCLNYCEENLMKRRIPIALLAATLISPFVDAKTKPCDTVYQKDDTTIKSCKKQQITVTIEGDRLKDLVRIEDVSPRTPLGGDNAALPKLGKDLEKAANWVGDRLGIKW